jgi:hypothetical protein
MPVIPKYTLGQGINQQPAQTSLNREGTGAVARALGGIGGQVSDFANELLFKRKQAEATTYANDMYRTKQVEAQRKEEELFRDIDPATGRIKSTGRYFYDEYEEWELGRSDELYGEAPTDLALETFKGIDRPATNSRLLQADARQQRTVIVEQTLIDKRTSDEDSKNILSVNELDGSSAYRTANESIDQSEKIITSKMGLYYDEQQTVKALQEYNNVRANAGINALFNNENVKDLFVALKLSRGSEGLAEVTKILEEKYKGSGYIPMDASLRIAPDGTQYNIVTIDGKEKVQNLETGEILDQDVVFPDVQEVDSEVIGVDGTFLGENKVHKYLTPEEKTAYMFKLANLLDSRKGQFKQELSQRVADMTYSLNAVDATKLRVKEGNNAGKAFEEIKQSITNLRNAKQLTDLEASNMLANLDASRISGEYKDINVIPSFRTAQAMIDGIPAKVKEKLASSEISKRLAANPEYANRVAGNVVAEVSNHLAQIAGQINDNMATYLNKADPTSTLLNQAKRVNEVNAKKYFDHIDRRATEMGVPPTLIKYFDDNELATDALTIQSLMKNNDMGKAYDYIASIRNWSGKKFPQYMELLERKGLPEGTSAPLYLQNRAQAMESLGYVLTRPETEKILPPSIKEDIRRRNFFEAGPFAFAAAKGKPQTEQPKIIESHLRLFEDRQQNLALTGGTYDATATKKVIQDNFAFIETGTSKVVVPKMYFNPNGTTEQVLDNAVKLYSSKEYILNNVDLEASFSKAALGANLKTQIDTYLGGKAVSKYERNKIAYDMISNASGNIEGTFEVRFIPSDTTLKIFMKTPYTTEGILLKGSDGKAFSKDFYKLKDDAEVMKYSPGFFSREPELKTPAPFKE